MPTATEYKDYKYDRESERGPLLVDENEFNDFKCEVRNRGVLTEDLLAPKPQSNSIPKNERSDNHFKPVVKTKSSDSYKWSMKQGSLGYKLVVAAFTVLALVTRFYKISNGDFVLWDEAHFGKFGTHYIDGTFYFDVHPPLGKMLVGLAGRLSGYDGGYGFTSGEKYPDNIPYVKMRMIIATFGSLVVPFSFVIAKNLKFSNTTSLMIGALMLLEVGLIGITRLILLDSMLIFFGTAVITFYTAFRKYSSTPFTKPWHLNLFLTGLAIGCVSSVKWVGFFVTGLVGLLTVEELWKLFGDWKISYKTLTKHFLFRSLYLILLPISIYLFCFQLHFKFLFRSGPGNANMSSLFQASLEGTSLSKSPLEVAYGSKITLRSLSHGSGILHSHIQTYPEGSKQQQITLYAHNDENNEWIIHRSYNVTIPEFEKQENHQSAVDKQEHIEEAGEEQETAFSLKKKQYIQPFYTDDTYQVTDYLKDGDHVRLYHNSTGKYLHSHHITAPVSATDLEVSAYGHMTFEDPNDIWIVEIEKDDYAGEGKGKHKEKIVRSLFSQLRFKHLVTGCYLRSSGKVYPSWGFKHGEVSCKRTILSKSELKKKDLLWNVETHTNSHLPEGKPGIYKSKFFDDFISHNIGMWRTNNALIPDSELEPSALTSKPYHWMFLLRGLRMSGFGDDVIKFYMLGNPLIWWASAVSICLLLLLTISYTLLSFRNSGSESNEQQNAETAENTVQNEREQEREQFWYRFKITVGSWAFNYLPYFLMGRVTYLHHYYPALIYAIISIGFLFEHFCDKMKIGKRIKISLAVVFVALTLGVFIHYAPMAYGFNGPSSKFAINRKLLKSWNLA